MDNLNLFKGERLNLIKHALIVSKTQKWIYFNIGRTGGTSVYRRCLEKWFKNSLKIEGDIENWTKSLTEESIKEYFSFTFVRNPFDRVVSVATRFGIDVKEFVDNLDKYVPNKIGDIETREDYNKRVIFFHAQPCSIYTHIDGKQILDFVGKLENVQYDYERLCEELGILSEQVPHIHQSNRARDYKIYYDDDMIRKVEERYKDDIKLFNYKF